MKSLKSEEEMKKYENKAVKKFDGDIPIEELMNLK